MDAAAALSIVKAVQIPLGLLAALHLSGELWPPEPVLKNNTCFDYIVVGGGTAGMVVASRLTEDENINVLVIEAGGNPSLDALLASLFVLQPETYQDWNFTSTYDSYAANSQPGNVTKLTSGKMLGGSSSMNHFIYVRGSPKDYNEWADIVNDNTWRYENVLPYFKKSEHLKDPVIAQSQYAKYHGFNGPMGIARQLSLTANPYLASFGELGNKIVMDINGPDPLGYAQGTLTLTDGVKQSSAYAYIRPAKDRKNLFVLRHTYATKILFNNIKQAIGVEAYRNSMKYVFIASREVIVCAGTFKTPQLLMLSGIGPAEHLKSFDINVIADLPVGDNWQEQVTVSVAHKMDQYPVDPVAPLPTLVPFPVLVGLVALNKIQSYGDYEVFGLILGKDTPNLILACAVVFGLKPEICDQFNNQAKGYNSLYSLIVMLDPKSRGTVRLKSKDSFADPQIKTGFYEKETDLDNMVAYIKDYIKVTDTTFFYQVNASLIKLDLPECEKYIYGSDKYWRCYVLHTSFSVYHSTSTCPMGTVLDSHLKVRKVTKLRVVDASSMPKAAGNPHAVVIMLAEKASDMIKKDAHKFLSCEGL